MTINPAATMNAPTAAGKPPSGMPAVMRRAAPGVDQAIEIGIRKRHDNPTPHNPLMTHNANRPEAAMAGVAPALINPFRTMGNAPAKPTSAARHPAKIG